MEKQKVFIPIDFKHEKPKDAGRYMCYVRELNDLGFSHFWWNCCFDGNNSWTDNFRSYEVLLWLKEEKLYCFTKLKLKAYIKLKISSYMKNLFKKGLSGALALIIGQQFLLIKKTNRIMATQKEAAAELVAFKAQLTKVNTEIQAKIQALTDAANSADNVSPELQAAIDDLAAPIQQLDDISPDAPAGGDGGSTGDGGTGSTGDGGDGGTGTDDGSGGDVEG